MRRYWILGLICGVGALGAAAPATAQTRTGYPSYYGSPWLNSPAPTVTRSTAAYPTAPTYAAPSGRPQYRTAATWQDANAGPAEVIPTTPATTIAPPPPTPAAPAQAGTASGSGDVLVDGTPYSGGYGGYGGQYQNYYGWCGAGVGGGTGGYCEDCGGGPLVGYATNNCCNRWNVYVGGLGMTRDRPNKLWTTYQTNVNERQLAFPPDSDWAGGGEVRLGRSCGCNCEYKLEAVFWILDDMTGDLTFGALQNGFQSVSTPLNVTLPPVEFPSDDVALDEIFDSAAAHRISRTSNFLNVELNLWGGQAPSCGRFSGSWLAGVRYLRFRDNLLFGSVNEGFIFGLDPSQEAYIESDVENNLVGFQIGGRGECCITHGFSAFVAPTVGIYGNHISQESSIYRGTGELANGVDTGNDLVFDSSKEDFAMLGQIDVGLSYTYCNWRLYGGYRAIGMTGVALADNQIPFYVGAEDEWLDIDSNGSLILHGGFGGVEYRF